MKKKGAFRLTRLISEGVEEIKKAKTPTDRRTRPPAFLDLIYGPELMMADGGEIIAGNPCGAGKTKFELHCLWGYQTRGTLFNSS